MLREQPRRDILPFLNPIQITTESVDRPLELPDLTPHILELGRVVPPFLAPHVSEPEMRPRAEKRDPEAAWWAYRFFPPTPGTAAT